jgi:hypothetical protein
MGKKLAKFALVAAATYVVASLAYTAGVVYATVSQNPVPDTIKGIESY